MARDEAVGNSDLHGSQVIDRQFGVNGPDDLLQSKAEGFRWPACANHREDIGDGAVLVRNVNSSLSRILGELDLLRCPDDANNSEGLIVRQFVQANKQTTSHGAALRPVPSGEIFINDADSPVEITAV